MDSEQYNQQLGSEALLLTMWNRCQDATGIESLGDVSAAMDLAFLAVRDLHQHGVNVLCGSLNSTDDQAFSSEVLDVIDVLTTANLLVGKEHIAVTHEGKDLADTFWAEVGALPENRSLSERLDAIVCEYATLDGPSLRHLVEEIQQVRVGEDARSEAQKIVTGSEPVVSENAPSCHEAFFIPVEWQTTLELCFSPAARDDLAAALDDFQNVSLDQGSEGARELLSV